MTTAMHALPDPQPRECETCLDSRTIHKTDFEMIGAPWHPDGYYEEARLREAPCPDCVHICAGCHIVCDEAGDVALRNFLDTQHFCDAECLSTYLARATHVSDSAKIIILRVAQQIYLEGCGCDWPDKDEHSNGCIETVRRLNEMIECATKEVGN